MYLSLALIQINTVVVLDEMLARKPTQNHHSQRKIKPPILSHTVHSGLSSEPICVTVSASRF